jgi:hypothetical protein
VQDACGYFRKFSELFYDIHLAMQEHVAYVRPPLRSWSIFPGVTGRMVVALQSRIQRKTT